MEPAVEHERAPSAPPRRPDRPDVERPAGDDHAPARTTPGLSQRSALALQRKAGNRAVAALAAKQKGPKVPAQRTAAPAAAQATSAPASASADTAVTAAPEAAEDFAPPVQRLTEAPDHRPGAASDPKFKTLKTDVSNKASTMRAHPPATKEADAAAKAAKPPADDKEAQGKAANAEKMNAAKPGEFDKAAFIKAVNDAIAAKAPKNLDEADKFGDSGKADGVKQDVSNKVGDGKKQSSSAIETTTKAPPDLAAAKEKPVEPLAADKPPATPGTPDPAKAIPDKAPPAATDFSQGPKDVNAEMASNEVTEEQLAKGNEPAFDTALKEKKAGEEHAKTAPGEVRAKENETLTSAKADAQAEGANAMKALSTTRNKSGQDVSSGKGKAQSEDERKRVEVTGKLQKVFDATKTDVEKILTELDGKVDAKFTTEEAKVRKAFTDEHSKKMDEYKDKRYSGFTGKLKWVKDKFMGLPAEANQIFVAARQTYVNGMQGVISGVADLIGQELGKAKQRIAKGREDLQLEVQKLPKDLQAIGKQAAGDFSGKFDELTEQVNSKQNELVDTLATKYNDALKAVDEEIAAEKEKNKGLVAKAMDAVAGVIKTIIELKNMLMNVLARAVQAVMAIIKDPIGFLGNLISAIGSGLKSFIANIAGHLKKGLIGWLLGTASGAGLQLPAKFDLQGILGMIASMLGLTWAAIRGRIVSKGVPEQAMVAVEASVPIAQKLASGGVAGIWEDIKEQVGDLKENLLGKITEYLVPTVLVAGITWIISLLNPASAFIKACKAIIDIVTFIFTRGAQIMEFVNSVLDAIIAIAKGGGGGVGALIENALAKSIPVLIGFLAALLGVGGIADKVKKFFQALSKPVMKAVDWVVGKIVGFGKKIWAKLKDKFGKKKDGKDGKPGDAKDVEAPKKLVEPAEVSITKVSPELAKEISAAEDGKTIHQGGGGDPKQVTKSLLTAHSDAKYDKASGTLTLPKVSDPGASSLSALGSQLAGQTGVSKVSMVKKGESVELYGEINPRTRLAKIAGLPTDEALLRIAVTQNGIVDFLKAMAAGKTLKLTQGAVSGDFAMADLVTAWGNQKNVDFLKNKFRDAMKGSHEWLPSNYILEVTQRAAADIVEGPKWIDLQHELRSDTFQIVYSPSKAAPEIVNESVGGGPKKDYSVPSGHVGAVYYPGRSGKEKTAGSSNFHDDLRTAFTSSTTVKGAAAAALAVAKAWVWDGSAMNPEIHPACTDKNGSTVSGAGQAVHRAAIEALFKRFT
ncbi:hypothetical protein Afil01_13110 [Actinorhabdospora filicis]|uniref:Uncharacterized protein n=1 Tax=Actinorhabdospora filicis TaxID=1785913 RepID=A0A9W6W7F3_9ACTN|nr:hypothetical protein Afil01_13110 [Actinorhabdospora filicis]